MYEGAWTIMFLNYSYRYSYGGYREEVYIYNQHTMVNLSEKYNTSGVKDLMRTALFQHTAQYRVWIPVRVSSILGHITSGIRDIEGLRGKAG